MKFNPEKVYIPDEAMLKKLGIVYPQKPDEHMLEIKQIYDINVDENYPYLDKSFIGRLRNFGVYCGLYSIVFIGAFFMYGLRICGRENIRKNRKLLKNGAVTVANHCFRWDLISVLKGIRYRRLWFPAWQENLKAKDRYWIVGVGGIPIPYGLHAHRQFMNAFDELHSKKKWMHVFPEGSSWTYYPYIRPFKKGAFSFADRYDIPVLPMAFSYREPKGLAGLFAGGKPLITLNIGEPILPNKALPKKECIEDLRARCHKKICELAGIKDNPWNVEGD